METVIISTLLAAIVSIVVSIFHDRFQNFFDKQKQLKEIEEKAPQIQYRRWKDIHTAVEHLSPLNSMFFLTVEEGEKPEEPVAILTKISSPSILDCSPGQVATLKISNTANRGISVCAFYSSNSEITVDKSFLGFFDIIPGQNLCIFMPSEPLYVDKFKVIFGKYILTYKMSRDRFGFLLPTIEKKFK